MRIKLAFSLVFFGLLGCGSARNQPAEAPKDLVLNNPHGANTSGAPDLSILKERHKERKE